MVLVSEQLMSYTIVSNRVRSKIERGEFPPGGKLPTEKDLADTYGVSRGTARKAYSQLIAEGLIESRNNKGHFVRESPTPLIWRASDAENNVSTDDGPQDTWSRCVRDQGRDPAEDIRTEIVLADAVARQYLHLPGEVPLLARRRFRYVGGEPSSTADSFYLREHVAGTSVEMPRQVYPGVYAIFADAGLPWTRTVDHVLSRAPTRDEARGLQIYHGVQVTEVRRVSYTHGGIPVRLTRFVLPGDRHIVEYEHRGEAPQ